MPLNSIERERVFLSSLGYLRQSHGAADWTEIAYRIYRKDYDAGIINNISEYRAIARRAADAFDVAGQYGPEGDVAPDVGSFPTDPTGRTSAGDVSYRVVVEVTDGAHVVAGGAVTITAHMTLTANEIRDLAVDTILSDSAERDYRNTIGAAIHPGNQTNVYVISGVRG